jgi:4-hydroxythreonine-4-phosphate dehydrogenase
METNRRKPVLAVPLGDAAGIGPEIVAKVAACGFLERHARPVIVGDERVLRLGMNIAGAEFPFRRAGSLEEAAAGEGLTLWDTGTLDAATLELGKVSPVNGKEEGDNLAACIEGCKRGLLDGICFAPLNKAALKLGGYNFPSEHEMFAHLYGITEGFGEMNVLEGLWNIRVTSHIPLKDVSRNITVESVPWSRCLTPSAWGTKRCGGQAARFPGWPWPP